MPGAEPKRLQSLREVGPQPSALVRTVRHPPVPREYRELARGGRTPGPTAFARLRRRLLGGVPVRRHLADELVECDRAYSDAYPQEPWELWFARRVVDRLG